MDLEKFFDTVNHSKLVEVLSRTIKDGRVVSLFAMPTTALSSAKARGQQRERW